MINGPSAPTRSALSRLGVRVLRALQKQTPQEFAPTCYDARGRLVVSDEDLKIHERKLYEGLVEPAVAKRIERTIKEMEERDAAAEK